MEETPEQKKDRERRQNYIEREGLTSCMNNTKWQKLLDAVAAIPNYQPRFRAKCLGNSEPNADQWEFSFPFHVPLWSAIEWIEFDPIVETRVGALVEPKKRDCSDLLVTALKEVRVPFSKENGNLRVWGYIRSGSAPDLV